MSFVDNGPNDWIAAPTAMRMAKRPNWAPESEVVDEIYDIFHSGGEGVPALNYERMPPSSNIEDRRGEPPYDPLSPAERERTEVLRAQRNSTLRLRGTEHGPPWVYNQPSLQRLGNGADDWIESTATLRPPSRPPDNLPDDWITPQARSTAKTASEVDDWITPPAPKTLQPMDQPPPEGWRGPPMARIERFLPNYQPEEPGAPLTQGQPDERISIGRRILEGAEAGTNPGSPLGISPENIQKYPALELLQIPARLADTPLRVLGAAFGGIGGGIGGLVEHFTGNPQWGDQAEAEFNTFITSKMGEAGAHIQARPLRRPAQSTPAEIESFLGTERGMRMRAEIDNFIARRDAAQAGTEGAPLALPAPEGVPRQTVPAAAPPPAPAASNVATMSPNLAAEHDALIRYGYTPAQIAVMSPEMRAAEHREIIASGAVVPQETPNDRANPPGLPGQVGDLGAQPVQAEPVQGGGGEAAGTGRVVQEQQTGQAVPAPADQGVVSPAVPAELPGRPVATPSLQDILNDPRSAAEIRGELEAARNWRPTEEWQDVPQGAALPPGVDLKVNPDTGQQEARLAPTPGSREAPVRLETPADVTAGAEQTAQPTPAQADAGNYQKRHIKWRGLDISIETEAGQQRTGISPGGTPWSVIMPVPYGYLKRTVGKDGDHLDVYLGPQPQAPKVFVVDQIDPDSLKFDEHKILAGFPDQATAAAAYEAAFSDGSGRMRIGAVTPLSVPEFKAWLASGDTKKPLAYAPPRATRAPAQRGPLSLFEFLASKGGIRDQGGELRAMDLQRVFIPGFGRLVRPGGRPLDMAREAAVEAGYLRDTPWEGGVSKTTIPDLLNLLDQEHRGQKAYSEGDLAAVQQRQADRQAKEAARQLKEFEADVRAVAKDEGLHASDLEMRDAAKVALEQRADPLDALVDILERNALADERAGAETEAHGETHPTAANANRAEPAQAGQPARLEPKAAAGETPAREQLGAHQRDRGAARSAEPATAAEPAEPPKPAAAVERTPAGAQHVLPGTERIGQGEQAQRKADQPLKPKVAQKPADTGLFGDESRQTDLVDMARKPAKPDALANHDQQGRQGAPQKAPVAEPSDSGKAAKQSVNGGAASLPPDIPTKLFRGTGRADVAAPYNKSPFAVPTPILGNARYFAFKRDVAANYGPKIDTADLGDIVSNPLVVRSGQEWRALTKTAGWNAPNPFGTDRAQLDKQIAKLRQEIEAKGHDGVIVWWDDKNPTDTGPSGENIKLLRNVFGDPQVIAFKEAQSAKAGSEKPSMIEDFGEKIEGARKDTFAGLRDSLREQMDVATEPLSKSFPQPNYEKLIEAGANKKALAFIAIMRDMIPSKPRVAWKAKQWAAQVEMLRTFARQLLDGEIDIARVAALARENHALRDLPLTAQAIEDVAPVDLPKAAEYRISSGSYSMLNGKRYSPSKTFWFLEKPDRRIAKNPLTNDPADPYTYRETPEEAVALAKKIIAHELKPTEEGATTEPDHSKYTPINAYRDRVNGKVFLGFKVRSTVIRLKADFENAKAALEYLSENRDALQTTIDNMRAGPNMRGTENRPRTGQSLREGDVTPEAFSQAFGFRGVQFGNYVEGGRRQADLNRAFDALMDLGDVLDIPAQALSLNGELGLAFGARGHGGRDAAAAHYEPGRVVINLTKGGGPGSLAHEWLHAVDSYFGRQEGGGYISERKRDTGPVRREVYDAWKNIEATLSKGSFADRSVEFDKARHKPYWSTTIEKAARAFERYVIDRLSEKGAANDYLANIDTAGGAYPTTEEMQGGIRAAYDRLFDAIETRQTDRGVAMYSLRAGDLTPAAQARRTDIERMLSQVVEKLVGRNVHIQFPDTLPFGGNTKGWGSLGEGVETAAGIYIPAARLIALAMNDPAYTGNKMSTAFHEAFHAVEHQLLNERELALLKAETPRLRKFLNERVSGPATESNTWADDIADYEVRAIAFEMYAYRRAEGKPIDGFHTGIARLFNRLMALLGRIRNALRGMGFKTAENIFSDVYEGKMAGRKPARGPNVQEPQYSLRRTPETKETREASKLRTLADKAMELIGEAQMKVAPMAVGSTESMAAAKDYANAVRLARHQWSRRDDLLKKNYTPDERRKMWEAADQESVAQQMGAELGKDQGLAALSNAQRSVVESLQSEANAAWTQAQSVGIVEADSEGLPSYVPRMVVMMNEAGHFEKPPAEGGYPGNVEGIGRSFRTSTGQVKHRKYMTAAETEAAMKARFGETATIAKDIRALSLATAKLREAIAARTFVNKIKSLGNMIGEVTVSEGAEPQDGRRWFTLDHPAFKTYRPLLKRNDETGKWEKAEHGDGTVAFERVPIYIRSDFKGPLLAVMGRDSGKIYNGLMALKGKAMSVVMYSPVIHNMVEYSRALPAYPLKVAFGWIYFEGNRAKNDPAQMREAINAGMVPIGKRFFNQDITSIMEEPNLAPGRSWTADVLGFAPGLFDARARNAVKAIVDKAGDVWHNTLLWDRVGDLQMGLYVNMRRDLIRKGHDPLTASRVAAHFANRYAGALPIEAMSTEVRKFANLMLFSRTFTLGNLGAMKDAITGLPRDVQAQILRDAGPEALGKIKGFARRKSAAILMLDIALGLIVTSLLADVFKKLRGEKDWPELFSDYYKRFMSLTEHTSNHPLDTALHPINAMWKLSSTATNEPRKREGIEARVLLYYDRNGRAVYGRNPFGKIGEEFTGWPTAPGDMILRKLSTFARPALQTIMNDKYAGSGFERPTRIWRPNPEGPEWFKNMGRIAQHFIEAQLPADALRSAWDLTDDESKKDPLTSKLKILAPLGGISISQGHPQGMAGALREQRRQERGLDRRFSQ